MGEPDPLIDVHDVARRFGRRVALERASLRVRAGELIGLVGPNGAGKSTLLRILAGFLDPDRGRVTVTGRVGYLAEGSPLPPEMRVVEYLAFRASLKRIELGDVIERAGLEGAERRLCGQLSKGYRQRVGLADALLGAPPVLLLDEPASGLDPLQTRELRTTLASLAPGRAIVMSTHSLGELEELATRVVVIAGGKVVADDAPDKVRGSHSSLEDAIVELCR